MLIVKNERGMVLLMVLLVVALLATILTELSFSTLVDMRLAETFRDTTRANYLARGGLNVGKMLLQDDGNAYDSTDELWAIGVQQYPVADGSVTIEIIDLGGRVDLNQLVQLDNLSADDVTVRRYTRLLQELDVDQPDVLVDTLIDWIDSDGDLRTQGAENAFYVSLDDPYQCKNGRLDTLDELALVRGYDQNLLKRLRPHVTAYGGAKVNINTASREVLLALAEEMDITAVETMLEFRQQEPFTVISQVKDLPGMENLYGFIHNFIDVKSLNYQIESTGWVNDGRTTLNAVVDKPKNEILFQRVL